MELVGNSQINYNLGYYKIILIILELGVLESKYNMEYIINNLILIGIGNISMNPNINMNIVKKNPEKDWDWKFLSWNPNINMDIITENLNKPWDWSSFSENMFQKEKDLFYEKEFKKYLSAYKIQQYWKNIILSPKYKIGRKFINKKYDKLFNYQN